MAANPAEPATGTLTTVNVQMGSLQGAPPVIRFMIAPFKDDVSDRYQKYWHLGARGDGGASNARLDSGVDIPCCESVTIKSGELKSVGLGVVVRCLRLYWSAGINEPVAVPTAFNLVPRSSIAKTQKGGEQEPGARPQSVLLMPNSPGVIDVGYRGELKVQLFNPGAEEVTIAAGEAVVQVVAPGLQPAEYIYIARDDFLHSEMVPSASKNDRGDGGFGSTGLQGSSGK